MLTLLAASLGFGGGFTAAWVYGRRTAEAVVVAKPKRVWRCRRK